MFTKLRDVPYIRTPRISTGVSELDWIYGGDGDNWGPPKGKISLWSGPSGTGKSRSLITVAKTMSSLGRKVLYFQNEVTLSEFRGWAGKGDIPPTLYGSEATSLAEQLDDIVRSGAEVAIVDSVNQIEEFGGGHKAAIKKIYDGYRQVTKKTGVHIIFICQLDKQNMIKGGSELLFLSDISIKLGFHMVDKKPMKHHFTIGIGHKHRYGKMGEDYSTVWRHIEDGAECISSNRRSDEDWCKAHRLELIGKPNIQFKSAPKGHLSQGYVDPISGAVFFEADCNFSAKKRKRA